MTSILYTCACTKIVKVIFGDLTSVSQDLLHYFDAHITSRSPRSNLVPSRRERDRPRSWIGLEPQFFGIAGRHSSG